MTIGFCFSAYDVDFEESEPQEDVDVEAVLDTEMVVVGIEPQRHMDMGNME